MCHNLGVNLNADAFTPQAGIYGARYQWGRKTPALSQGSDVSNYTHNPIAGWNTTPAPNNSWSYTFDTGNDL